MLSKEELATLEKLQEKVSDLELDDVTCTRFLVAREFDLDKAELMIRNNVKWRNDVGIENIYNSEVPQFIKEDFSFLHTGTSRNGGPVYWLPIGRWKARYWIERGEKEEAIRFSYRFLESMLICIKEMSNNLAVVIFGMEELTYHKVAHVDTLKVLFSAFQALEQNYPETLQNLIVVNAPWVFSIAFNFVKPILSPKTLNKIKIYGSDKKQWLPVLEELCPERTIPKEYLEN